MIDLASVRQRPAMYVGGTDETGVTNLVLELVANVVDQHLAGRCTRLSIEVAADGTVLVEDNGPGIAAKVLDAHLTLFSSKPTVDGHRPHVQSTSGSAASGSPSSTRSASVYR